MNCSRDKDKVLAEDNFTASMQEAILQSKLVFERRQDQEKLMVSGVVLDNVLASLSKEERKWVVKHQKTAITQSVIEQSVADVSTSSPPVHVQASLQQGQGGD